MSIHLENIPKKEKLPKELKCVSPSTNFYNKDELNIIIIKISKK
jgi:hypothetical protein